MELTLKERLLLANQFRILEKLHPEEAGHYAQNVKILERGYALDYQDLFDHFSEGLTVDECREVIEILDMFRMLETAYARLDDKSGIDQGKLKFSGFDGNNESTHLGYADFLINTQGRWQESQAKDLNSHLPKLESYRRMLQRWESSVDQYNLGKDDILRIVA
jgi:uncharacterized protein YfbU (UPF0304 family)